MANTTYEHFKTTVNSFLIPASVIKVKKAPDGTCSEASFFVVNEAYKKSFLEMFKNGEDPNNFDSEAVAKMIEGTSYSDYMPKDTKFESILIEAAWEKKNIRTRGCPRCHHAAVTTGGRHGHGFPAIRTFAFASPSSSAPAPFPENAYSVSPRSPAVNDVFVIGEY